MGTEHEEINTAGQTKYPFPKRCDTTMYVTIVEHVWVHGSDVYFEAEEAPFLNVPGTVRNEGRILHDNIINLV